MANLKTKFPKINIIMAIGWLFLWLLPWQSWLNHSIWVTVGISLLIFIIPGTWLFYAFYQDWSPPLHAITFGFTISHLIIALLGTLGRFAQISFNLIWHSYMFLGLVVFIFIAGPKPNQIKNLELMKSIRVSGTTKAWPILIIVTVSILMSIQRTITADDLTYLALITKFQHSSSLSFDDVILGAEKSIAPRFWLMSTPFSQAFLAKLSGLHGIYWVGGFYEPFLTAIALLSYYNLAKYLGLSQRASIASLFFQIGFLALLLDYFSPGAPFFTQLSVDKATASYIIFPVFIQSIIELLESPSRKNFLLSLMIGLSLSIMHAVTLAFTLIVVVFILLFRFRSYQVRSYLPIIVIICLILTPQIFIRFANPATEGSIPNAIENIDSARGNENLFTVLGDTPFYGFSPSILAMSFPYQSFIPLPKALIQWGWTLIPFLSTIFAIRQLKNNRMAQFLIASFLLIALAGIPFSGWILGYLVSPRMLARTVWLYPYGIAMSFLLISIRDRTGIGKKVNVWAQRFVSEWNIVRFELPLLLITIFSTTLIVLVMRFQHLPNINRFQKNTHRYQELATIGYYLDEQINDQAIVIGSNDLNDLLPGISGKANGITFRPSNSMYAYYYTQKEREDRFLHQQQILSNKISPEECLDLIRSYKIKYLLIKSGEYQLVKNLISTYPDKFERTQLGRYLIFEINE